VLVEHLVQGTRAVARLVGGDVDPLPATETVRDGGRAPPGGVAQHLLAGAQGRVLGVVADQQTGLDQRIDACFAEAARQFGARGRRVRQQRLEHGQVVELQHHFVTDMRRQRQPFAARHHAGATRQQVFEGKLRALAALDQQNVRARELHEATG